MIPFADALRMALEQAVPLAGHEEVALTEAYGRFLAEPVTAQENIPIADNSAMDGFAVRAADVASAEQCRAGPLQVVQVLAANALAGEPLQPGQAMKIMTGAPIPPGADAVVMRERTREENSRVWIDEPVQPGHFVRPAGGDLKADEAVFGAGERLSAARVGMLASMGVHRVRVVRQPRVGVLATGDEIVPPEAPLAPGTVRDANSYSLVGLVRAAGAEAHPLGIAGDDREHLRRVLEQALREYDVLISSGGVSMGDFDFIKTLVDEVGLQVHYQSINIKPGKPVVFASRGETLFFGLPGNPVSSMVTFLQLVRPALLRRQHAAETALRSVRLPMAAPYSKNDGKRHFVRGVLAAGDDGTPAVRPTGDQSSALLSSMGRADCLLVIEEAREKVAAGELVEAQLLDGAAG